MECSSGRDLTSPTTRLIGHWEVFEEGKRQVEEYFGALDADSMGSYIGLTGDSIYYAQYRVLSENEDTVRIELFVGTEPETIMKE